MLNDFHPTLRDWFAERFREPTAPQRRGCPAIRAGGHVPVAAADPLNLRGILKPPTSASRRWRARRLW